MKHKVNIYWGDYGDRCFVRCSCGWNTANEVTSEVAYNDRDDSKDGRFQVEMRQRRKAFMHVTQPNFTTVERAVPKTGRFTPPPRPVTDEIPF